MLPGADKSKAEAHLKCMAEANGCSDPNGFPTWAIVLIVILVVAVGCAGGAFLFFKKRKVESGSTSPGYQAAPDGREG